MKKILGIAAVALIVGAPVMAQNASTMAFTLGLNGAPSTTGANGLYDTTNLVEVGPVAMASNQDVINWSARVTVGGTIDLNNGNGPVTPGGAANIVFDLALKKDGVLVGGGSLDTDGGFGIGTPGGEAGFYSSIMWNPAGGFDGQEPAAFPWVFETFDDPGDDGTEDTPAPPYGRLTDPVSANGPNMAQFTYPSTFKFYRATAAGTPVAAANTTTVTAASGTLMGMGAGYTDFDFTQPERGGIGLTGTYSNPTAQCYGFGWQIDSTRPIVEGQINMKGMPGGTYTLELTAGAGNNVLLPNISCNPLFGGANGAFAAGVPTANVTGSTITFVYNPVVIPPQPVMASATSVRSHAAAGSFGMPLAIGAAGNASVEPRQGGVQTVVITYDKAMTGTPAIALTATGGAAPTLGTATLDGTATVLTVTMTGAVNKTCVNIAISGLTAADGGGAPVQANVKVTNLVGDVDGDHKVLAADVSAIKSHTTGLANVNATNFWYDIDANSKVQASDISLAKTLTAPLQTIGCAYP